MRDLHQVVQLVRRALQIADLPADVAELAVDDEVGGQHVDQVAEPGVPLIGHPQHDGEQPGEQGDDQQRLHGAGVHAAAPGAPGPLLPGRRDGVESLVFAPLRAEGLDHRVAGHRVRQRAAEPGVGVVRGLVGRRHVGQRQPDAHGDEHADRHGEVGAQRRLAQEHRHREADQRDHRRTEVHHGRVGEGVVGPHAPGDLAHGGAGEVVGVPVGAEALHALERVAHHAPHDVGGEAHPDAQIELAHGEHHREGAEQPARRRPGAVQGRRAGAEAFDARHQLRRARRDLDLQIHGQQHAADDHAEAQWKEPPVAPDEGQDLGESDPLGGHAGDPGVVQGGL